MGADENSLPNVAKNEFRIALPDDTYTIHSGVTPPDDWFGSRYTYDGTTWAENPKWENVLTYPSDGMANPGGTKKYVWNSSTKAWDAG